MEIYSVDSAESPEKYPVARYYPKWDWKPGTCTIPAMHATPQLVPKLL